ncbi:MAG: MFS transporter [Deltaproteobacteria bacterium]|nr:MFS transporter [Deltaproteobacteria bacterium]
MTQSAPRSTQILVVLALINLVAYAARNSLLAVYPDLTLRYGIDYAQIGFLQTVFMLPHAIATLGFGWAGDRYDRRRVIVVGVLITSVAGAAGALTTSYEGLALSRAVVGFGTAAIVPVANSILGQLFNGPNKASRIAIFNLGLFFGGVAGVATGMALGFPNVVVALGVPGILLAVVLLRQPVPTHPEPSAASSLTQGLAVFTKKFLGDARVLLKIRTLRWVIASTTVMAFAAGGLGAWFVEFLECEKGMGKGGASTLFGLALFGGLAGVLTGGRIADRLRTRVTAGRLWTIVIGVSLTTPFVAMSILVPAGVGLYIAGVATMFFISWYHAPVAATVDDLAPVGRSVAAQGLVIFTMHLLGTAPSSWVIGIVSKRWSLTDAMWVPTVALGIAAVCMAVAATTFAADASRARASRTSDELGL